MHTRYKILKHMYNINVSYVRSYGYLFIHILFFFFIHHVKCDQNFSSLRRGGVSSNGSGPVIGWVTRWGDFNLWRCTQIVFFFFYRFFYTSDSPDEKPYPRIYRYKCYIYIIFVIYTHVYGYGQERALCTCIRIL